MFESLIHQPRAGKDFKVEIYSLRTEIFLRYVECQGGVTNYIEIYHRK